MKTATITLKTSSAEKKRMQRAAKRENKSLNAYVLGKESTFAKRKKWDIDYSKTAEHLGGRFSKEEAWRLIPGRE